MGLASNVMMENLEDVSHELIWTGVCFREKLFCMLLRFLLYGDNFALYVFLASASLYGGFQMHRHSAWLSLLLLLCCGAFP